MKKLRTLSCCICFALLAACSGPQEVRLLVGTYTENTAAEGVYLYSFNTKSAEFTLLDCAPAGNPSFVITNPEGTMAYSVNEFNDGRQGVSSYALSENSVKLLDSIPIPKAMVDGEDPCNILYTGSAIVSSNYTGGTVSAFSLGADGRIEGLSQYSGGGIGSGAHMHCAVISPDGKYIFVTNLGNDCIHRYENQGGGSPLGKESIAWQNPEETQYGPRHMVFSADGRFAYLLCELSDHLLVFSYSDGSLEPIQDIKAYNGDGHGSADLHITPDGRHLYTSHRLKEDGISCFSIDSESGKVIWKSYTHTGIHPRNFAISPDGRYLLCACRDSNAVEIYLIGKNGSLRKTGATIECGAPVCVQFVP